MAFSPKGWNAVCAERCLYGVKWGQNLSLYQLLHCNVYNQKDEHLGKVTDILETGAHLNLRVHKDDKSFLLPFVDAFVKEVDPEEKIIRIEDMEGLH